MPHHPPYPVKTYPSIDAYYADVEAARASQEYDFGSTWRDGLGGCWRVSWVLATGHLYAHRAGPPEHSPVLLLGQIPERGTVLDLLRGWEEYCGRPDSLDWVRARIPGKGAER